MFLCDDCHKLGHGDIPESKSYGKCEHCGEVGSCFDCHNYNFRPDDEGWEHRVVDGKVQVHIPYPIDLWAGCVVPEHDPRGVI